MKLYNSKLLQYSLILVPIISIITLITLPILGAREDIDGSSFKHLSYILVFIFIVLYIINQKRFNYYISNNDNIDDKYALYFDFEVRSEDRKLMYPSKEFKIDIMIYFNKNTYKEYKNISQNMKVFIIYDKSSNIDKIDSFYYNN